MGLSAAIYGLSGQELTGEERAFIREAEPWGFILFQRNCASRVQVRSLTDDLRTVTGRAALPILIDEEGGRVQRLKPPEWRKRPAMAAFGTLYAKDAARGIEGAQLNAQILAADLAEIGATVDCVPCLDIPVQGAHDVIGDRAFAKDPVVVARLGRIVAETLLEAGLLPVLKHMPGHGRASVDTHEALPRVSTPRADLSKSDFAPFKALSHLPLAMSAHVIYEAIDETLPATLSPRIIQEIIRDEIGFGGLLMTDDLNMKALSGGIGERAARAIRAGCDIALHCNGKLAEMQEVAKAVPDLEGKSLARAQAAERRIGRGAGASVAGSERRLAELLA